MRQPVGAERGLRLGPAQAGAEAGGQRAAVDLDVAEAGEVERDDPGVGAANRLDPADDAGAAAERDDRDPLSPRRSRSPGRRRRRRPGSRTASGAAVEASPRSRARSRVAAPGGVADPVLVRGEDPIGADRVDQRLRQRLGVGHLEPLDLGRERPRLELADPLRAASPGPRRRARARPQDPPIPTTSSRGAARRSSLLPGSRARSRPASASSRIRPWPPRIIGEPNRESPRRVCSEVSATLVPPSSASEVDLDLRAAAGVWRTASPRAAAPRRSARPRPS